MNSGPQTQKTIENAHGETFIFSGQKRREHVGICRHEVAFPLDSQGRYQQPVDTLNPSINISNYLKLRLVKVLNYQTIALIGLINVCLSV